MKDVFIGIDPDDTLDVPFGKATFKLGVLPSSVWEGLKAAHSIAITSASRNTIRRLVAEGVNPDELVFTIAADGFDATRSSVEAMNDPEHRVAMAGIYADAAKYGVRGHEKFANRAGVAFKFETVSEVVNGDTFQVLTPATLRVYRANLALLKTLWMGLHKLNDLGVVGKKD